MKLLSRILLLTFLGGLTFFTGCVKDDFDEPPVNGEDPKIEADQIVSLEEVMNVYESGEFVKLNMDKYVKALVIANDESGTFYKALVIQDENSDVGMTVLADQNNLAAEYPVGRRVFVHLKDLWISDYNNLPQLGYGPYDDDGDQRMSQIPGVLVNNILRKGMYNLTVEPKDVNISSLGNADLNRLIRLTDVQFVSSSVGETYANSVLQQGVNHGLESCNGEEIIVRTSGFANFADERVPEGKGTLIAVYSIYRDDKQLLIRSLEDVQLNEDRCGSVAGERITIADVRAKYTGTPVNGDPGYIEGVVISDYENENITGRNLVIQDETGGIVVRFDDFHNFGMGSKIQVTTSGIEISEFNGTLQLNNVPTAGAEFIASESITPKTVTINDVLQDFESYESTLIKIENPTLSGGSTFAGNLDMTDASGQISLFTRNAASFANEAVPTTVKSVVGIVGEYTQSGFNPQISMRNIDDIDGEGGGNTGGDEGVEESFNGGSANEDIAINNWDNVLVQGERRWQKKEYQGNGYAQATAYNDTNSSMESWLIAPEIDGSEYSTLTFKTAKAFYNHDGLSIWVTSDYTGDVTTTSWTEITTRIANQNDEDHEWIDSDSIDLSSYGSKVRVAFKYVGNGPNGETTSYRIDDVVIK